MALWTVYQRDDGKKVVAFFNRANGKRQRCGEVDAETSTKAITEWILHSALPGDVVRLDDGSHLFVQYDRGVKA